MARNRAKEEKCSNKEPLQDNNRPEEQKDFGYSVYPERSSKHKQGSIGESLFTFRHKCQIMLQFAMDTSPYAKLLLGAMKRSGCAVHKDRHFSCEDCEGTVSGGFDAVTSQIVLCQNNIHQQAHMNRVVTHELIHAFDHCRARVDWFSNFRHLACSEVVPSAVGGTNSHATILLVENVINYSTAAGDQQHALLNTVPADLNAEFRFGAAGGHEEVTGEQLLNPH